jgi:HAD superfamily hydrolase (TIGR02253 family)
LENIDRHIGTKALRRKVNDMIKLVIFDLDNTLMDFSKMKRRAVESAVDAMIDSGLTIPKAEMMEKIFHVYKREGIEDQKVFDKTLEQEFGAIDYKILAAGIVGYKRGKESALETYPHVHIVLTTLARRGVHCAIITDAPRLQAWTRIASLGLQHFFERVITLDDTGERKPSPKPFNKAMEFFQVQPQETLMIGDWAERDIVGAKNLGIKTAFARYGDDFNTQNSGADYELQDISELIGIIDCQAQ